MQTALIVVCLALFMLIAGGLLTAAVFAGHKLYKSLLQVAACSKELADNVNRLMPLFEGDEFQAAMKSMPQLVPRVAQGITLLANMQTTLATFNRFVFSGPEASTTTAAPPEEAESKVYAYSEEQAAEREEQEVLRRQGHEYDPNRSAQTKLTAVDGTQAPAVTVADLQTDVQSTPA